MKWDELGISGKTKMAVNGNGYGNTNQIPEQKPIQDILEFVHNSEYQ
ncbi:MAG: hypothetical protein IK132_00525 [Clostridia bacterium]|nr:hypothetical protein [Clostridia bacterium]